MFVSHVIFGPNNSVILEGDALDADAFSSCTAALTEASLEVKPNVKFNPRLIIHNIRVEYDSDAIAECVLAQNFPSDSDANIKIIYLYPAGEKKFRSCVIETTPELRAHLLRRNKICIGWRICCISDHISVRQHFGHIVKNCTNDSCCSYCAGDHETVKCKNKIKMKCVNCTAAK